MTSDGNRAFFVVGQLLRPIQRDFGELLLCGSPLLNTTITRRNREFSRKIIEFPYKPLDRLSYIMLALFRAF